MGRRSGCGTYSGYNKHIEEGTEPCAPCRLANAKQADIYRKKRILNGGATLKRDAAGTRRRIQALAHIGYMFSQIADKMGTDRSYIANLNSRTREMVYPSTADKVIALYNEFSMIPVYESTWMNLRARNEALRKGFPGPLAWDDNIDDPYALPSGLTHPQAYVWFWNAASMTERIEWVLEHGLSVTRLNRSTLSRKHRRGSWQVL